ncbi:MAG: hypothetical protein HY646_00305 [Acidobacteria bacterium]|nr:hypothetical protein [Acidobacteriota bacterium]
MANSAANADKQSLGMRCFFFFGAVLVIVLYGHALDAPLYLDDKPVVMGWKDFSLGSSSLYPGRSLSGFSVFLSYRASEVFRLVLPFRPAFYYRLFSVFFHLIAATTVVGLAYQFTKLWAGAFLAGTLYLVHPIQTSAVVYIAQRYEVLAAMFTLLSAYSYVRFRQDGPRRWLLGTLFFALAAIWSKENGLMVLPLLVLIDFFLGARRNVKWIFYSVLLVLAGSALAPSGIFSETVASFMVPWPQYVQSQGAVIAKYLQLIVYPREQYLFYDFPIIETFTWVLAAQWSLVLGLLALSLILLRKRSVFGFGIAAFFLLLSPVILVPSPDLVFEYRLYPAVAGIAIAFAALHWTKRKLTVSVAILTIGVLSYRTIQRNYEWTDEIEFMEANRARFPTHSGLLLNLGSVYFLRGAVNKATEVTEQARRYEDRANDAYRQQTTKILIAVNLAALYAAKNELDAAHREALRAATLAPRDPIVQRVLAGRKLALGDFAGAKDVFRSALRRDPGSVESWLGLAAAFSNLGDTERADLAIRRMEKLEANQQQPLSQTVTIPAKYQNHVAFGLAAALLAIALAGLRSVWQVVSEVWAQKTIPQEEQSTV